MEAVSYTHLDQFLFQQFYPSPGTKSDGQLSAMVHGVDAVITGTHEEDKHLYDNKICTGDEAAESLNSLKESMKAIGYEVAVGRGDYRL